MERRLLDVYYQNKTKIKIFLKNNDLYSGMIIELYTTSLLFLDKFDNEISIDMDSISHVVPINGNVKDKEERQ